MKVGAKWSKSKLWATWITSLSLYIKQEANTWKGNPIILMATHETTRLVLAAAYFRHYVTKKTSFLAQLQYYATIT